MHKLAFSFPRTLISILERTVSCES